MIERLSFNITYVLYIISFGCYLAFMLLRKEQIAKLGFYILSVGWVSHSVSLISRWMVANRPPLANQFEFASSFAWGIALCFIYVTIRYKYKGLGLFITPVILLITTYGASLSKDIAPLMPALQSNWLFFHVFTAVFSYGAFGVAFGLGILYLVINKMKEDAYLKRYLPTLQKVEPMIYKTIAFGFLFLTLVIVSGAIWAQQAWTRYWAWDPKETWSLITWIIYAIFLHVRFNKGIKGNSLAWFSIIGFVSVLFTYMGVNVLLPSLHSYL